MKKGGQSNFSNHKVILQISVNNFHYKMECSFSALDELYDTINGGRDVQINDNQFKVMR